MTTLTAETPVRGRYAPSPTGALHLGNLRTALLAWLAARKSGGAFVLRVEDLDIPRLRPHAMKAMLADLRWLGLEWDEGPSRNGVYGPYIQSQRLALYDAALAYLRQHDLIYPCYCTRSELAALASAPHGNASAPRYSGACRMLSTAERRERERMGQRPSLRFRTPDNPITFHDALANTITENVAATVGDFIVRRSDGVIAYQLAVVVDDALMGITQVVRGSDLLSSTARQLALFDALGYPRPREFGHVPLALDPVGQRMSKRDHSSGLAPWQARGVKSEVVLGALAASCGFWPAHMPATPTDLLTAFDFSRLSRSPSVIELQPDPHAT